MFNISSVFVFVSLLSLSFFLSHSPLSGKSTRGLFISGLSTQHISLKGPGSKYISFVDIRSLSQLFNCSCSMEVARQDINECSAGFQQNFIMDAEI